MTAKEYLMQAWNIDQRINSKLDQVARLRQMATNITSSISDMPRSASPDKQKMEKAIVLLADTEDEIDADIDVLVGIKIGIMKAIGSVTDLKCRMVLELRYCGLKSWEEIAEEMGASIRWVHNLHAKGLSELEKNFVPVP